MCATLINAVTLIPDILQNQIIVPLCPPFPLQAKSHQNTGLNWYSVSPLELQTCGTSQPPSSLTRMAPEEII